MEKMTNDQKTELLINKLVFYMGEDESFTMNEDSFSPLGRMNKEQSELLGRIVEKGNLINGALNFCSKRLNISTIEVSKIINGIRNEIPGRNPKETEMVVSRVTNLYQRKQVHEN